MRPIAVLVMMFAAAAASAAGPTITVRLPEGMKVAAALAASWETKVSTAGTIDLARRTVTFEKLFPDTPYQVALTLADGTVLQGVNLGWYGMEPPKPDVAAMSDDDAKAVTDLFAAVKTFENKKRIVRLSGDADRVTALVELTRDQDFHAAGGNIIWRVELWYYKNQFGGWQKVAQQSKVLRRERFADQKALDAVVPKVRWVPELGGIKMPKGGDGAEVVLREGN